MLKMFLVNMYHTDSYFPMRQGHAGAGSHRHLSPSQRQLLRHHHKQQQPLVGGGLSRHQTRSHLPASGANTDDSSLGSFHNNLAETTENDADIDEFSDGVTTQDDGGESTEPEHPERTMYFGQVDEKPR